MQATHSYILPQHVACMRTGFDLSLMLARLACMMCLYACLHCIVPQPVQNVPADPSVAKH